MPRSVSKQGNIDHCDRSVVDGTRRKLLSLTGAAGVSSALSIAGLSNALAGNSALKIREFYNKDLSFSELALSLDGERITVKGYMAPPLKAASRFFVLTRWPMTTCPFCNDADEWPDDILAIYAKRQVNVQPYNAGILVQGKLQLNDYKDPDNGFFSRVRLDNATFKRA